MVSQRSFLERKTPIEIATETVNFAMQSAMIYFEGVFYFRFRSQSVLFVCISLPWNCKMSEVEGVAKMCTILIDFNTKFRFMAFLIVFNSVSLFDILESFRGFQGLDSDYLSEIQ